MHLRRTLSLIQAKLIISAIPIQPTQRQFDFYLMDIALQSPDFSARELCFINYCRLYFRALTVSDLTSASGKKLAPGIISGMRSPFQSISTLHDPYQERPGLLAWRTWRRFLHLFSSSDGTLFQPLGPWLYPFMSLRRRWPYLYSPSLDLLFRLRLGSYSVLHRSRPRVFRSQNHTDDTLPPPDCIPVEALPISDGWRLDLSFAPMPSPEAEPLPTSFPTYIQNLPDHE